MPIDKVREKGREVSQFSADLTEFLETNKNPLYCNKVKEDSVEMIYISDGSFIVQMTEPDYDVFVRPAIHQDPGNWVYEQGVIEGQKPHNLVRPFKNAVQNADYDLTAAPMVFSIPNTEDIQLVGYYSKRGDFISTFNAAHTAIMRPGENLRCRSCGRGSPMVMYLFSMPKAVIPTTTLPDMSAVSRTVRAWFTDSQTIEKQSDEAVLKLLYDNAWLRRQFESMPEEWITCANRPC